MRKISPPVLRYIGALYGGSALVGCSDSQLLERFIATSRDADRTVAELAFASLVERHGRMVWHVCRSLVFDDHDAEDAFQATFLVLLTKAGTLRIHQTLGPWLHAVAYRTALNSRSMSSRRRSVERAAAIQAVTAVHTGSFTAELEVKELGGMLHQAIMELPTRFRAAVLLCDFEGLSYLEAAASLGIPVGTLQSRLGRARRRLRDRLNRHGTISPATTQGLDYPGGNWVNLTISVSPPRTLLRRTCHLAVSRSNLRVELDAGITNSIQELTSRSSRFVVHSKLNGIAALLVTAMIAGGVIALQTQKSAGPRSTKNQQMTQISRRLKSNVQVAPPPGANLPITPAPAELNVVAGQGKACVYALDASGERIRERPGDPSSSLMEERLDIRWAVVTGVVDHQAIQKSFSHRDDMAIPPADQIYRRVQLERQIQQRGVWSEWRPVDQKQLYPVLDNLPVRGAERIPRGARLDALVDPLPVLTGGVWEGVDVERLVLNEAERTGVLMLRSFDFAVEPGETYRYRARLIFFAPPKVRGPVRGQEFRGPWSEPTEGIKVR